MLFLILIIFIIVVIIIKKGSSTTEKDKIDNDLSNALYSVDENENKNKETIATWKDGVVWYGKNRTSPYGTYSADGTVCNRDGEIIGMISGSENDYSIVLDRHYLWERLKRIFNEQNSELADLNGFYEWCKKVGEICGNNNGGVIDCEVNERTKYYYRSDGDQMGAGAAFLILVQDEVIQMGLHNEYVRMLDFQELLIRQNKFIVKG